MMLRLVTLCGLALLVGCHHEPDALPPGPSDDLGRPPLDLAVPVDLAAPLPDLTPPPDLMSCTANAFMGCVGENAVYCNGSGDGETAVPCGASGCLGGGSCGQCTPSPASCNSSTLESCDEFGRSSSETCVFGCSTTNGAHCLNIIPSNGWVIDCNQPTGTLEPVLSSNGWLNTDDGSGFISSDPVTSVPPGVFDAASFTFHLKSLHISDGATFAAFGSRPLVLLVDGDVRIDGVIDVAAHGTHDGSGATSGMGDGKPGRSLAQTAPKGAGGGGGSYATSGGFGAGGTSSFGPAGALYPAVADPSKIVPLLGGARGGAAPFNESDSGGGGGAIQIISCGTITLGSTGLINAGGGGAWFSSSPSGGPGGGSGGAILLEAPAIQIDGVLAAAGGSGGGGGVGGLTNMYGAMGWDAPTDTQCITVGGAGASGNGSKGGTGGVGACGNHGATDGTLGVVGTDPAAHGGGGGGGGRIRLNTTTAPTVGPDSITPNLPACYSTGTLVVQ